MPANSLKKLKEALDLGLGIVTRIWDYRTKDWVTGVYAADIDANGDIEIIACSRDGRVHLLSKEGNLRWQRIIGGKAWVGTGIISNFAVPGQEAAERIVVGTRNGQVFVLGKDGKILTRDGEALPFDADGRAINQEQEQQAFWCDTEFAIRQISIDPRRPSKILIGSEDRCAHALDYETGEELWRFQTNGWVRTICSGDMNGDGEDEILVGSVDRHLYLLNQHGNLLVKHTMNDPVHIVLATDVDNDGHVEILAATDGKDLIALNYVADEANSTGGFQERWRRPFENRLLSLCVTDIDADGRQEVIVCSEDKHIYILDTEGKTIWRHNHKYRIYSIYPFDIDNDGLPELLVGSADSRVRAMRIRLVRDVEKKVRKYHRWLGEPNPADIPDLTTDERALLEDIVGRKAGSLVTLKQAQEWLDAKDYDRALATLLELEQQKVERLWRKDIKYIRIVCPRHIIGTPTQEIIVGTAAGEIFSFHDSGRRNWSKSIGEYILDIQTGFIDHHRQEEIIICSSQHHVYILSNSHKQKLRSASIKNTWMSSICVIAPNRRSTAEIIIGSEDKKLYIYGNDLKEPRETLPTDEGVRIVRAHAPTEGHTAEIVTASLGRRVYAYSRSGGRLWFYETRDRIRAICIKDINNDGKDEVLVGSEDRNIHVLDNSGKLLWRYFLPHSVLAIDATDHESKIFAGCADGYLYVFNKEGDLRWSYQTRDRIQAVRVEDIDDDGQTEVIIGVEDQLEVLRMLNPQHVSEMIEGCWMALCQQQPARSVIANLLHSSNPFLQTFALNKLSEQGDHLPQYFDILEKLAGQSTVAVRKALMHTVMAFYSVDPQRARELLAQLWTDKEQDVRNGLVEHIQVLLKHDRELAFYYLRRAAENPDRFVRRLVIRTLYRLIDAQDERPLETHREIFRLLLAAVQDKESEWIRQEAARTLAHLLNRNYGKLIIYIHLLIVKQIPLSIWQYIEHAITIPNVKSYLQTVILMLAHLNESNVPEQLKQIIDALEPAESLIYGKDIRQIYVELYSLFTIQTLAGIANYRCMLNEGHFDASNKFARIILDVFKKLSIISRPLTMYLRRESAQDRVTNLLETIEAIDQMRNYIEQQYSLPLLGEPIAKLPDHQVFVLLLEKWRRLVQAQLNELRGKAELQAELLTKDVRSEEQVGICLAVKNRGHGLATVVNITLLHDDAFEVVGNNSLETEAILPQEDITAEFTIKPHGNPLTLKFDIAYDDADNSLQFITFEDSLALREIQQEFRDIPNSYSTGTPTSDSKMFYGREKDMAFLKDNLTRQAKSVIVLYGQRRSGKTTVLLQLIHTPILGEHISVLIDMQRFSYSIAIDTFLYRVAYAIAQAMKRKNLFIHTPDQSNFRTEPIHTFDVFLDHVEEQLAGRKLILLIDEFEILEDQVTKEKLQPEIFDYLRDIVQHRQNFHFLFAGTHKITEYTRWYRSIFFNIAIHHQISKLSPQGAQDLIQKPVAGYLEYEPLTVGKIRRLTADQPYLIHQICRAVVDYCNEQKKNFVTIVDVNTVLRQAQGIQFHFDWLWDQITPEARVALATLAEGGKEEGRWLTFTEIEDIYRRYCISSKAEYIQDSLNMLIEADIVENKPGDSRKTRLDSHSFRIPMDLIRSWLLKEHPLEIVCKEMLD